MIGKDSSNHARLIQAAGESLAGSMSRLGEFSLS